LGIAAQAVGLNSERKPYLLGEKRSRPDSDDDTSNESPVSAKKEKKTVNPTQTLSETLLKLQEGEKEMAEKKFTAKNSLREKELEIRQEEARNKQSRKDKQLELEIEREKSRRIELELALLKEKNKIKNT
jgi:hypothetical protein